MEYRTRTSGIARVVLCAMLGTALLSTGATAATPSMNAAAQDPFGGQEAADYAAFHVSESGLLKLQDLGNPAAGASTTSTLVTQANLNLRTGNSTRHKVILTMPKGASVKVLSKAANGWYKLSYKGRTGWASGQYLKAAKTTAKPRTESKPPATLVTQENLNMRTGSSTKHKIVLTIPKGANVKVLSKAANGWYKVNYKGRTGWASGQYLKATAPKATPKPIAPQTTQGKGPNLTKSVVLTYDDCPLTLSAFDAVVKYAAKSNIGLVLAPTGNCLASFKSRYGVDLADRARAHGQWVINHSVSHPDLRRLSCANGAKQLQGTGVRTNWGRPPYGAINDNVRCAYQRADMRIWTWTVDTMDWQVKNKKTIVARASQAKAGDTVLMHMQWQGFDVDAIRQIGNNLGKRGLTVCKAYHGPKGGVQKTPVKLPASLPC